ncbi:MAG: hypothetical protein AVDCRST_MAG17-1763, partial [uncultured Solirubrobacterales bacterium]
VRSLPHHRVRRPGPRLSGHCAGPRARGPRARGPARDLQPLGRVRRGR